MSTTKYIHLWGLTLTERQSCCFERLCLSLWLNSLDSTTSFYLSVSVTSSSTFNHCMALNSLLCADVPLRTYTLSCLYGIVLVIIPLSVLILYYVLVSCRLSYATYSVVFYCALLCFYHCILCIDVLIYSAPQLQECLTLSPPIPLKLYAPFLIFDIRALWRSGLSARAPECQKSKLVR